MFLSKCIIRQTLSPFQMPATDAEKKKLDKKLKELLTQKEPVMTAFPPCSDILLSLVKKIEETNKNVPTKTGVEIVNIYHEYFELGKHKIFPDKEWSNNYSKFFACNELENGSDQEALENCLPSACQKLEGNRRLEDYNPKPGELSGIRRLFIADLVWLYYMEYFEVFGAVRKILHDYQYNGWYPIASNSLPSIVIEAMIRETRKGSNPTIPDRYFNFSKVILSVPDNITSPFNEPEITPLLDFKYSTKDPWPTAGNELINENSSWQLAGFIKLVLSYYKERKLAQGSTFGNMATLVSIRNMIDNLKTSFKAFDFGRVYYNTLNEIVWLISGLGLIWELRQALGINRDDFYETISVARDEVAGWGWSTSNSVYFKLAHGCANDIRSILLDLEVLDTSNLMELQTWLDLVENKFESFRIQNFQLTGNDVAGTGWFNPEDIKPSIAKNVLSVPKQIPVRLNSAKGINTKLALPGSLKMLPQSLDYIRGSAAIKKSPFEYRSVKIEQGDSHSQISDNLNQKIEGLMQTQELVNLDLQDLLQKQQQQYQILSNISKMRNDSAMDFMRKLQT